MSAFVRRFAEEPDEATLLAIESVVIVDGKPPAQVRGIGTGTVLCVGEFEDGLFCVDAGPVETFGDSDLRTQFGDFGFTYSGVSGQHPCCRARSADSATTPETWNGSGYVHLYSGRFRRLFIGRVDTSVGEVEFNRLASISGATDPTFDLAPGQTIVLSIDGASNVTVTFDAAAGVITSGSGTYPWAPAGGETLTFKIDGTQYVATFLSSDTSAALVRARLNEAAGYTAFAAGSGTTTVFTGLIKGTSGSVQIVAVSGASVTTATGFSAGAAVAGTGDVANIDAVTVAEANTRVLADTSNAAGVDRDYSGAVRIFSLTDDGTGTIEIDSTSTATAFGWETEVEHTAASGVAGKIPAGTRVQAASQLFVTMQTINVTAANPGPYSVKVRHATDDQTGTSELAGAIDTVYAPIQLGAFSVTNPLPVTATLTDAQIDARYVSAIEKTRGVGGGAKEINISFSARQSNAVRAAMKQNAIDASALGCFGRVTFIRPPLGTTRAVARGSSQPGVGAYRSDYVGYAFPGVQKYIPAIAAIGTAGGTGFTADGIVNVGFDMARASLAANLNPEEDKGQETQGIVDWALGIESGNADVSDLQFEDYVAFKAAGIGAPRFDGGSVVLQSDVTTVDPTLTLQLVEMRRRQFSNFVQDSLAQASRAYVKKLSTSTRRATLVAVFRNFFTALGERISGFQVDGSIQAGNTPESLARNVYYVLVRVRMTPTMAVIVLKTEIGNEVVITEG